MLEDLVEAYALVYAVIYEHMALPIFKWYSDHRWDADYWTRTGWLVGFFVSIIMIFWGTVQ